MGLDYKQVLTEGSNEQGDSGISGFDLGSYDISGVLPPALRAGEGHPICLSSQ